MSEATSSQGNAAAGPSGAQQPRPTTPIENRAVTAARHESNKSTPRTIRSNGKYTKLTELRDEIAYHMDGEFVECPVEEFIQHYLPFEPTDKDLEDYITKATYTLGTPIESAAPPVTNATRPVRATTATMASSHPQRREDQILEWVGNDLRFVDYNELPVTPSEATTYRGLETIINAIGRAAVTAHTRNNFHYYACSDTPIRSETGGSNNRIDGCIISNDCFASQERKVDVRTTGIAVAFEFKLKSARTIENNLQVVSANVQLMNDDVRRKFTYGVTVVDEMVTLWYHGRSHSAVSEPFSFVKNPQLFIKTMMSFLFATDVELGYDPTITRLQDNRLVFTMTDEQGSLIHYRTVRGLSDYRSCNITGRMTRVWEVEKVSEPNETGNVLSRGVLKDVWLDESALTERQVQEAIFKAIEARSSTFKTNKVAQKLGPTIRKDLKNTLKKERYKKFFLTILADWQGELSKIVSPVAWRRHDLLLAEVVPETEGAEPLHSGVSVDRVTSNVPRETRLEQERTARKKVQERVFHPKRQYRVVFQELCVTVGHLPTLGEVMNLLNQTLGALRLLYFAGWVHRDLSTGNVMAYEHGGQAGWQAKLCDLEYAKQYSTTDNVPSGDPKMGTPYFMAVEILKNKPLLPADTTQASTAPVTAAAEPGEGEAREGKVVGGHGLGDGGEGKKSDGEDDDSEDDDSEDEDGEADAERDRQLISQYQSIARTKPIPTQQLKTVIHNFQHDVESLWWISLYTATARIEHSPSQQYAKKIFQHRTDLWDDRGECLLHSILDDLQTCLRQDVQKMATVLDVLRGHLVEQYHTINLERLKNGSADDTELFAEIHQQFYFAFQTQIEQNSKDYAAIALIQEKTGDKRFLPAPQRRKRARSVPRDDDDYRLESDDDEEDESGDEKAKRKVKGVKRAKNADKQAVGVEK